MKYNRDVVVNIMRAWLGARRGDKLHQSILDEYAKINPLPRGHKVTVNEAWCAATVSAAYHKAGYDDIWPAECSCGRIIELAKAKGIWVENDGYIPKPGDGIIFSWKDDGKGDCTTGHDHIGMVESVKGGKITTIEGNKGTKSECARRVIAINAKTIRGFVVPKFDEVNTRVVKTTQPITVWKAPLKIDANRLKTIPEGYAVTVELPSFVLNGDSWYHTIKDAYVLAKYCK